MINDNPDYNLLLLEDFNFECKLSNTGFSEFCKFMSDYSLMCCDSLDGNSCGYSYSHATLDHCSLIDHVFVLSNYFPRVHNYSIMSDSANLSDHLPITFELYCNTDGCVPTTKCHRVTPVSYTHLTLPTNREV